MGKSLILKIVVLLALVQGIAGMLRALNWVQIGVDLFGRGLLLVPFVGVVAVMRGLVISVVALLFILFSLGALLGKSWSRWVCLLAVIVNLLLVLSVLLQGASVAEAIVWSTIPVVLLLYLFSPSGSNALKGAG